MSRKTRPGESLVIGKSISELQKLNPTKLSTEELKNVTSRMASAVNKRLRRIKEFDINGQKVTSPIYTREIEEGSGFLSVRGIAKNREALLEVYGRAKNILKQNTLTTRSGYREYLKNAIAGIKEKTGREITEAQLSTITNLFERLREADPWITNDLYKYEIYDEIVKYEKEGLSIDQIEEKLRSRLDDIYKAQAASIDTSDFFEIE